MSHAEIDPGTQAILDRFGFDRALFERLREEVASGRLDKAANAVHGQVEPPRSGDLVHLPQPGTELFQEAAAVGRAAIAHGQVAAAVLNGGMATRFGGVVKGTVEALDGKSFIECKLTEIGRVALALGKAVPTVLMNSFATAEQTSVFVATLLEKNRNLRPPAAFDQFVSLRLRRDGGPFRDDAGKLSLYAPGHGDFSLALRKSGELERLRQTGVRWITLSNVDNLGARLDPTVLGMHILGGQAMTVEVVDNTEGDAGGAPARVDGQLMLLEGFRFPAGFDHASVPVFNTNTFTFDLDALDAESPLTWFYVEKRVEGRVAIQLERLVGELSAFLSTQYLVVPRSGPRGRFFPIKTPADLESSRPALREMLTTSLLD